MLQRLKYHQQLLFLAGEQAQTHEFSGLGPFVLVLGQTNCNELLHLRRDFGFASGIQGKLYFLDLLLNFPLVLAEKIELVEEQLIGDDAQRPHIYF